MTERERVAEALWNQIVYDFRNPSILCDYPPDMAYANLSSDSKTELLRRADEITCLLRAEPVGDGWLPTAENVNALPMPLRDYIHRIETRCDPAGEVRELVIARDTIRALEAERAAEPVGEPVIPLALLVEIIQGEHIRHEESQWDEGFNRALEHVLIRAQASAPLPPARPPVRYRVPPVSEEGE